MKKTTTLLRAVTTASICYAGVWSCSSDDDTVLRGEEEGDDVGVVQLSLTRAPDSIRCVEVNIESSRKVVRRLDVTPGQSSTFSLTALPTGLAKLTGAAHMAACDAVPEGATPEYVSEVPVYARIAVRDVAHVVLSLVRNGRVSVGVDFEQSGPGIEPPVEPEPQPGAGYSSAGPYIIPSAPGVVTKAILTVGDSVNLKPDGETPYRLVGIPDGMGAYDNGDGTFTLLSNHELGDTSGVARAHGGRGAFVSKWTISKSDLGVSHGEDLMQDVVLWDPVTSAFAPAAAPVNFGRFCSADLPMLTAFHDPISGLGYDGYIFMNGEETGAEGRGVGHLLDGTSYELPRLGKYSWENSVAHPNLGKKTLVVGMDDSGGGQVYVYVGEKTASGSPVDQAGLTNGDLYGLKVVGHPVESTPDGIPSGTRFELFGFGNVENTTGAALETASNAGSVSRFNRPEDGHWDPNAPNDYYWVTTASMTTPSRLWRLRFDDIVNDPTAGGTIDMVLDGSEGQRMLDQLTVTKAGYIYLQEDTGGNVHTAKIWRYGIADGSFVLAAEPDPEVFVPGGSRFVSQDEESSGIIDASDLLGPGWLLLNIQVHNSQDTELVQGGQLMAMFDPVNR